MIELTACVSAHVYWWPACPLVMLRCSVRHVICLFLLLFWSVGLIELLGGTSEQLHELKTSAKTDRFSVHR